MAGASGSITAAGRILRSRVAGIGTAIETATGIVTATMIAIETMIVIETTTGIATRGQKLI